MSDSLYQNVGAFSFPYTDDNVDNTQLSITDPAQDVMLALFQAAINSEFTAAFQKAAAGTPLAGKSPVQTIWPGRPSVDMMRQVQTVFPLLAIYTGGETRTEEHTLVVERTVRPWTLEYILGPLDTPDEQRLGRMLSRVAALIKLVIRRRGHESYQDGVCQFGEDTGRIASLRILSYELGQARFAADADNAPLYHALTMQLEAVETDGFVDDQDPDFGGATFKFAVGDEDEVIPDLVVVHTEIPLQNP